MAWATRADWVYKHEDLPISIQHAKSLAEEKTAEESKSRSPGPAENPVVRILHMPPAGRPGPVRRGRGSCSASRFRGWALLAFRGVPAQCEGAPHSARW